MKMRYREGDVYEAYYLDEEACQRAIPDLF